MFYEVTFIWLSVILKDTWWNWTKWGMGDLHRKLMCPL